MDNSLKDEIDDGGSLLNLANAGPFSVIANALHWRPGLDGPKRSLTLPRLIGDCSLFSLSLRGDLSLSPCLLGLRSLFFSPLLFSFCVEEFSRLDRRASSPLMYFFALASTSAMVA